MNGKKWLVSVGTAILLAYSGWSAITTISLQSRLAVVEAKEQDLRAWLERVEGKLDRALNALPGRR